jgi:dipeptidyl aminopeptidase/acylaminoacyl peptidase
VVHVDERSRKLYFTARGVDGTRFLYHAYLYRVSLDGTGLALLTPEDGDHVIRFSPNGRWFVDTYSRVDQPPRTVLRDAKDGKILLTLEEADVSRLKTTTWTPPQSVCMRAADGTTEICGLMYTPSDFDPQHSYPLIDHIYPAPSGGVRRWGFNLGDFQYPRSLAELGFVVVEIAPRGTQGRSKAFLDTYQGHIGANTLPDHVAAIRELARRYSFIDSNRVGVYGFSGGGFAAATAMLRYPDLFKVGVAAAGNYDNRSYAAYWAEKFQGLYEQDTIAGTDNYQSEAAYTLANTLRGKLLLMQGDLDDNTHPAMTLRLVAALIAANKRFDLMIFPDRGHAFALTDPYAIRMTFDYFVAHLLGATPPNEVAFQPPPELN